MPNNHKQNNFKAKKRNGDRSDSFLEALRDLGTDFSSTVSNDLLKKGTQDIVDGISPFRPPKEEPSANSASLSERENYFSRQPQRRSERIGAEEKLLFNQQKLEVQKQVNQLQNEISKLAEATGDLAKEVQVAATQTIPAAGTYHKSFFESLIRFVLNLRTQVQESSFWLASWNKKSKKRNFYWNQAKKSGSSFMLHHDRSVATQTG